MSTLSLMSQSATRTALDISEISLLLFGVLLVVGLIGEYAESDRWKKHAKIFKICVILGVAGELLADGGIFLSSKHLQTLGEVEFAQLTRQAADEQLETARIYARLGPRHFTEAQHNQIADRLSKYRGIPVDVFVLDQEDKPTMDEAMNFGREIVDALAKSMDASGFMGHGCSPWPVVGVLVQAVQDNSPDRYAAGDILTSLRSDGVTAYPIVPPIQIPPCKLFSGISLTPSKSRERKGWAKILIIIGKKPTPILSEAPASLNVAHTPPQERDSPLGSRPYPLVEKTAGSEIQNLNALPQDNLTKFLAAWGALLSTFALGWTLYRDLHDRARLKISMNVRRIVEAAGGRWYAVKPDLPVAGASEQIFVVVSVVNIGRRPVQWIGWGGKYCMPVAGRNSFFIVPVGLPKMLNEGDTHSEYTTELNPADENIKRLFIWDASGKNWYLSRWALRKLREESKKFQAG